MIFGDLCVILCSHFRGANLPRPFPPGQICTTKVRHVKTVIFSPKKGVANRCDRPLSHRFAPPFVIYLHEFALFWIKNKVEKSEKYVDLFTKKCPKTGHFCHQITWKWLRSFVRRHEDSIAVGVQPALQVVEIAGLGHVVAVGQQLANGGVQRLVCNRHSRSS